MFTNITEEDIRVNCPEYAPMTIKMLNKLNPLKVNSSVNPLNPYMERRTAPTSINQFVQTSTYTFNRPTSQAGLLMDALVSSVDAGDVLPLAELLPDVPVLTAEPTEEEKEDFGGGLGGASPDRVDQFEQVEVVLNADGSFGYANNPSVNPFDAPSVDPFDDGGGAMLRGAGRPTAEEMREKALERENLEELRQNVVDEFK